MNIPLHYQISEYDCGPTSLLNGISFLFRQEEIPPAILRNVTLYCLDRYDGEGHKGKLGTSRAVMRFLSSWFNDYAQTGQLPVSSRYLSGREVFLGGESQIDAALRQGGVAVIRLLFDVWHYVLLTGMENGDYLMFDPYYRLEPFENAPEIQMIEDQPCRCNRIVPAKYFNREEDGVYSLGPWDTREAVLLFNDQAK